MGHHIFNEPQLIKSNYPCGFCGGESGQFNSESQQQHASFCSVWIVKDQAKMFCRLLGGDCKYSMKSASKSKAGTPCTNRPIKCPLCPSKPAVIHWKSSLKKHFDAVHSDDVRVQDYLKRCETSANELMAIASWNVKKVKSNCGQQSKKKKVE